MLLKQIQYFIAIVECNSFTRAAVQCYISQSAISQQMQSLEKEIGVSLLIRKNRRFSLTPAGEYFYSRCKNLLDEMEEIRRETVRIGKENGAELRVGYLRCYSGQELHQAIAEFARTHPDMPIRIVNGTHEELYDLLRTGGVDLILSDQRRAFSDDYVNDQLLSCGCCAELSVHNPLSRQERVQLDDLKRIPCILIASREQQNVEQDYYQNTLGFGGRFLFADHLEEGRLMVVSNRGFLPIESIGTLPPAEASIRRLPIYRGERQLFRQYCLFWRKERANGYMEEFAGLLRKLIRQT